MITQLMRIATGSRNRIGRIYNTCRGADRNKIWEIRAMSLGLDMKWVAVPIVLLIAATVPASAGQLQYQPVNPTFGGNPLNGSYLLGTANANNFRYLNNPATQNALSSQLTTTQQLQQALVSSLIAQASATAVNSILGTGGQAAVNNGTFSIGGETIIFNRNGGQINITLTDPTGSQTQITIPVPQF